MSRDAAGRWTNAAGCNLGGYSTGINSPAMAAAAAKIMSELAKINPPKDGA